MECGGRWYVTYPSRSDEFRVWNLSDLHLLNAACDTGKLKEDIAEIASDPHSFWVGGGDYADYVGVSDQKRFDPTTIDEGLTVGDLASLGQRSVEMVAQYFEPIKDKCLGLLIGNHEKHYQNKMAQENLHGWLCTTLGARNLGYTALMDVIFLRLPNAPVALARERADGREAGARKFRFFVSHGAGWAQTPGGKLNRLENYMQFFEADIYMIGHVHDQVGRRRVELGADPRCEKLVQRERVGVISGSYLRTYTQGVTGYGEQRGYRPVSLGAAWVAITPETRRVRAEI